MAIWLSQPVHQKVGVSGLSQVPAQLLLAGQRMDELHEQEAGVTSLVMKAAPTASFLMPCVSLLAEPMAASRNPVDMTH